MKSKAPHFKPLIPKWNNLLNRIQPYITGIIAGFKVAAHTTAVTVLLTLIVVTAHVAFHHRVTQILRYHGETIISQRVVFAVKFILMARYCATIQWPLRI